MKNTSEPTRTRVLLVDDEVDFTAALARRLDRRGLDVATASDGYMAYEQMEAGRFDVVVLDIRMPFLDGTQVLKAIRKSFPGIVVIVLSGEIGLADAMRLRGAGAFDVLTKPTPTEMLCAAIEAAAGAARKKSQTD